MKIINQKSKTNYENDINFDENNDKNVIQDKNKTNDAIMKLLIVGGIILVIIGIAQEIPSRELSFSTLNEYVGGDAYNAIIEASIKGGEIAGAMITKALYICSGFIITALGCSKIRNNN